MHRRAGRVRRWWRRHGWVARRWALLLIGAGVLGYCVYDATQNVMEGITTTAVLAWLGPGGDYAKHRR